MISENKDNVQAFHEMVIKIFHVYSISLIDENIMLKTWRPHGYYK